jgi:peroxiredoxin Q/BCP
MIKPGTRAPDFTLPDQDERPVSLASLLARGPLILYFYPADFTPGCTREACSLRDLHAQILGVGLQVVGVSPQSAESHRKFRDRYHLPFPLLCDPDKTVIRAYDVNGPLGFGVRRATFLIGQDGLIESAVLADLKIAEHEQFVRDALRLRGVSTAGG